MSQNSKTPEMFIQEMVEHQQKKLLNIARDLVPDATPEDIRNPQDFPELVRDTLFQYEDGILTGYLNIQTALRAR